MKVGDLYPSAALFLIVQLEDRWWEDTWMENELDSLLQRELGKKINPKSPKNILSLKCFQNKWDQSSEQCTAMDKLKPLGRGSIGITLECCIIKTQEKWLVSVSWQRKCGMVGSDISTFYLKLWNGVNVSLKWKKQQQTNRPRCTTLKICDQCLIFWGLSNKINKDFLLD